MNHRNNLRQLRANEQMNHFIVSLRNTVRLGWNVLSSIFPWLKPLTQLINKVVLKLTGLAEYTKTVNMRIKASLISAGH